MKLQPHQLTYIAEDLGKRRPAPIGWLLLLAQHRSEVVREGAIYGLAMHLDRMDVGKRLERMAIEDASDCIRIAAIEALEP